MKRTFDNFSAVDSGFASFVGLNPTSTIDNLIAQLPQKYQDAIDTNNLDYYLNASQKQNLVNALISISNNSSLSGSAKISSAIATIESALPYLKTPIATTTTPIRNSLQGVPSMVIGEVNTNMATMLSNFIDLSNQIKALALTDSSFFSILEKFDKAVSKEDQQILFDQIGVIANDTSLTSQQKIEQAKALYENAVISNSSNTTRSIQNLSPTSPDYIKIGLIALAVGIVGFMGYTALKK